MSILEARELDKTFGAVTAAADINVTCRGGHRRRPHRRQRRRQDHLRQHDHRLSQARHGTVHYEGRDITQLVRAEITRLGICRSFQIPQLFDSLTVRENMLVALGVVVLGGHSGPAARRWPRTRSTQRRTTRCGASVSTRIATARRPCCPEGVRKLLDIAMAMVVKPKILLLDEPTSGVSADEKFAIMDMVMTAVRAERVTILFVEHDMEIVSATRSGSWPSTTAESSPTARRTPC